VVGVSVSEQLHEQFSAWEERGRGWQVWPRPVVLEPAFRPFLGYSIRKANGALPDDARRPTIISSLVARLFGRPALPPPADPTEDDLEPEPEPALQGTGRVEFRLLLPAGFDLSPAISEQLVQALSRSAFPVSFELVATAGEVAVILSCDRCDEGHVRQCLTAFAPAVGVLPADNYLGRAWRPHAPQWVVELGLSEEFFRPLATLRACPIDPLTGLISTLSGLGTGEVAVFQVLFQATSYPWAESALRSLSGGDGRPLSIHEPSLAQAARAKFASPMVAAVVRLGVQGRDYDDALVLLSRAVSALAPFDVPLGQELIPLSNDDYDDDQHESDLLARVTCRSGVLLGTDELAALVHLPGSSVQQSRFVRFTKHTKPAPAEMTGAGLFVGDNIHLLQSRAVSLPLPQRLRHVHVVGATGTGKSTLLLSMIMQDIEAGRGVALLDPHGDLVDGILGRLPENRLQDVVLFDPGDAEYPIAFNILAAHSELERTLLSSDLVGIFRRLATSWGDQMNSVFANAILAILESSTGGTLLDLRRFLVDAAFRKAFLPSVSDPEIVYYWQHEYPLLRGTPQAPILTRLDAFLRPKLIRNMVGQQENRLDFARIMNEGKIVLARLSHGAIGEENSYLLGALLVAKLHQVALARQDQEASTRRPFFLYADEFQHFVTPSLARLLSGVRKYGLGLTLAHQDLAQLGGRSDELASAVLANAGTRIVFRVGQSDAKFLAEGFATFDPSDLQNLGLGEAIIRVERADQDCNVVTADLPPLVPAAARARREIARAASRQQYGTPREQLVISATPAAPKAPTIEAPPAALPAPPSPPTPAAVPEPFPVASPPARAAAVERPTVRVPVPSSPGRGGQQHKYLQELIRQFGEDRGFRATVEQTVLDGHGGVDVALVRGPLRLAFEITVTTPTKHEIGNVSKCLAAGFDLVVLVAADAKAQKRLNKALDAEFSGETRGRMTCVLPDMIPELLDSLAAPAPATSTVGGYRVTVQYAQGAKDEQAARRDALRGVIGRSLKRLAESEKQ
jgi:hypothetical protein